MSNVVIAIPLFMLMIIVALLPLLIGVYVYRDAKRRGMNAALWTLIAILAPSLIGFIIYSACAGQLFQSEMSTLRCHGHRAICGMPQMRRKAQAELPELLCSRRAGLDCMPEMCAATSDCAGRYRYTRAAQG